LRDVLRSPAIMALAKLITHLIENADESDDDEEE
jgi:hypothetical protein